MLLSFWMTRGMPFNFILPYFLYKMELMMPISSHWLGGKVFLFLRKGAQKFSLQIKSVASFVNLRLKCLGTDRGEADLFEILTGPEVEFRLVFSSA